MEEEAKPFGNFPTLPWSQLFDKFSAVSVVLLAAWFYADRAILFWTVFLSLAAARLCWYRATESGNHNAQQRNNTPQHRCEDAGAMQSAGVPPEHAGQVAELGRRVGAHGLEPLCDPLMLFRFLKARDFDLDAAVVMYRDAMKWRATFSVQSVMMIFGTGEQYTVDGSRASEDAACWSWHPVLHSREAVLARKYGFFGRLQQRSRGGEPIAIWRLGAADLEGYVREDLVSIITRAFVSHMEDMLQCGRAESLRRRQLVQARLLIDAKGMGLHMLRQRSLIKEIMSAGKNNFPEVNVSVTIVRAPFIFAKLWGLAKSHLTPVMQRKICILGENFASGLRDHAGLDATVLPSFLGGQGSGEELCEAQKVPVGLVEMRGNVNWS
mmetsp:Transcript_56991/g.133321  ORF Transcript_56991/g.133321 Transcript_56991/m.133321 type:complete len:381 (-) Transcript_56991:83-1225(-)